MLAPLPRNLEFCLATVERLAKEGRILDFGCGDGTAVEEGLSRGLDIYGSEIFYEGGSYREGARKTGLLGTRILEAKPSVIPFPNQSFDAVYANMVFEHVADLSRVLSEIARVLKPHGFLVSLFPLANCWREGHIGIPFAHRFSPDSKVGLTYVASMYRLGLGNYRDGSASQWARNRLEWIKKWCHYRPQSEVEEAFRENGLTWEAFESEYIGWRWSPVLNGLPLSNAILRRLGCAVTISRHRI
jgi:SAM-dependent methyltransferase